MWLGMANSSSVVKHIIFTIHGIRTPQNKSVWQEEFNEYVRCHSNEVIVYSFKYGYWHGVLPWLATLPCPLLSNLLRSIYSRAFNKYVEKTLTQDFPECLSTYQPSNEQTVPQIHLIAHSFGTWITHDLLTQHLLRKIKVYPLQSIYLIAPVVSAHIDRNNLDSFLLRQVVKRIFVYSSKHDEVCHLAPPPFGHAGYWGIIDRFQPEDREQARFQPYEYLSLYNITKPTFEHGDYFCPEVFNQILCDLLL